MTCRGRLFTWAGLMGACLCATSLCYAGSHPVPLDQNANCLECHEDHAKGDHVHPAVAQGCRSCHAIEQNGEVTEVNLKHKDGGTCFACHDAASYSYPHLPYASGMCTRCHNPHVSSDAKLLRSKVNEVCLGCHLQKADTVVSAYMPTIVLAANHSVGHPYATHPVSGSRDPLNGGEMSCVSCHMAHGGRQAHLLKMAAEIPEDAMNQSTETSDMCRACHLKLWGMDGITSGKRNKKKK